MLEHPRYMATPSSVGDASITSHDILEAVTSRRSFWKVLETPSAFAKTFHSHICASTDRFMVDEKTWNVYYIDGQYLTLPTPLSLLPADVSTRDDGTYGHISEDVCRRAQHIDALVAADAQFRRDYVNPAQAIDIQKLTYLSLGSDTEVFEYTPGTVLKVGHASNDETQWQAILARAPWMSAYMITPLVQYVHTNVRVWIEPRMDGTVLSLRHHIDDYSEAQQCAFLHTMLMDVTRAVTLLHAAGWAHTDLHSKNIWFEKHADTYTFKLGDIGRAHAYSPQMHARDIGKLVGTIIDLVLSNAIDIMTREDALAWTDVYIMEKDAFRTNGIAQLVFLAKTQQYDVLIRPGGKFLNLDELSAYEIIDTASMLDYRRTVIARIQRVLVDNSFVCWPRRKKFYTTFVEPLVENYGLEKKDIC
jgi:hypothetical protein